MQREIIQREKELIANISNLIVSSVFKRAFNEKEGTTIKKHLTKIIFVSEVLLKR